MAMLLILVLAVAVLTAICVVLVQVEAATSRDGHIWAGPGLVRDVLIAAATSASIGAVLALLGVSGPGWIAMSVALIGLFCWMGVATRLDTRSAWAPDSVMIGLVFWSVLYGMMDWNSPMGAIWQWMPKVAGCHRWDPTFAGICGFLQIGAAILGTVVVVLLLGVAWAIQRLIGRTMMTPPDLFALIAPVVIFGVSFWTPFALVLQSLALVAVLRWPALRDAIDTRGAAREGAAELGLGSAGWGTPLPYLAVALPALAVAIAASLIWPLIGS